MRVSDALVGPPIVRPSWQTFEATVDALVRQLVAADRLPVALTETAIRSIREREAINGTAMVDIGVSIPHARVDGVEGIVAAIAVSPGAVYEVAAGLPISIVVVVLSSPASAGDHLNFLSALSMLLQSDRLRDALRHATSAEEVLRLVQENEAR